MNQMAISKSKKERSKMKKLMSMSGLSNEVHEEINPKAHSCYNNLKTKILEYYQKGLVSHQNKKLRFFHMVVSIILFIDFYITGFILANYKF